MQYIKYTFAIVVFVLIADVLGYMAWRTLDQTPVDNFYLGTITAHVVASFK